MHCASCKLYALTQDLISSISAEPQLCRRIRNVYTPIKLRYPSPPSVCVKNRIILCRAMPRSMTIDRGDDVNMLLYISASIIQNANVLSPTSAWSWLSQYAMFFSPWRRFVRIKTMSPTFHSISHLCFSSCNNKVSVVLYYNAAVTETSLTTWLSHKKLWSSSTVALSLHKMWKTVRNHNRDLMEQEPCSIYEN